MGEEEKSNWIMKALDWAYNSAINGSGFLGSAQELAEAYLLKSKNKKTAIKSLINYQSSKCATSGFLTGIGGFITLPVTIPANLSSVLYIQMRMIATIAIIRGFDPKSDQVRTLAYACLVGSSASDILKGVGIRIGEKMSETAIRNISGKTITQINQKIGFRLMTKFGSKGAINLGKFIPIVGGVVGGAFDFSSTKVIGRTASKMFIE